MPAAYDHLVLISLDTLRSDCIGLHPQPQWPSKYPGLSAPNTRILDQIAVQGAYFWNCISAAPYTSASHATFFTGKWPLRHGVYDFFNHRLNSQTIFSHARNEGYRTLFKVDFPIILGHFLGFDKDVDEYIVEDDERFLRELRTSKRAVSFAHFGGIHIPYGFHNLHYGGDVYRQKVSDLEAALSLADKPVADSLVETYRDPADTEMLLRYKRIVEHYYISGMYDRIFSLYLEGIEYFLENRFQRFFEQLLDCLRGKRYLIVLFGDHGEEYDQDSYGHFNSLAEGVLQVPVVFLGSDVKPSVQGGRIRSIDVAPTLVEMLGLPQQHQMEMNGVSLAATLRESAPYPERSALAQAYVSNLTEFVEYQRGLLERGQQERELRHFLYKEIAYDGSFKLMRQHHSYAAHGSQFLPCPPRVRMHRRKGDGAWSPISNLDIEKNLCSMLDMYNQTSLQSEIIDVPAEVRQQLADMGYKV
jgi:choline-sulfatase